MIPCGVPAREPARCPRAQNVQKKLKSSHFGCAPPRGTYSRGSLCPVVPCGVPAAESTPWCPVVCPVVPRGVLEENRKIGESENRRIRESENTRIRGYEDTRIRESENVRMWCAPRCGVYSVVPAVPCVVPRTIVKPQGGTIVKP